MTWVNMIRRSLKWKFILLVLLVVIILVTSIGYFSYYESSRTIRNDMALFSEQILKQVNLHLNQYFLDYEYGFLVFGASYEFQRWLTVGKSDSYERLMMENRMEKQFVLPYTSQYDEMLSISIYNDDGFERLYRYGQGSPRLDYTVREEPWFGQVQFSKNIQIFVHESEAYENLSYGRIITMVKKFDYDGSSGLIKIDISPSRVLQILEQINLGKDSIAVINDWEGRPLLQSSGTRAGLDEDIRGRLALNESGSFYHKATDEMVMFHTLPYTGWKTTVVVPYRNVAEGVYRIRDFTLVIAAANMVLAVIAIWMISSSLTSRLSKLKAWIKQTQLGHLNKRFTIGGMDEVAVLGAAYNQMLDELEVSMSNLAESRVLQQQAVLSALQSQIHSHFLYNALESINSLANLDGNQEIMDMTVSLSNMLRYTSNYQQELVLLQDEMRHAGDFIRIMNIVYGNRIDLVNLLDDAVQEAACLKAVLQPIIENSVKHGFEKTGKPLAIHVGAKVENGYITLAVHDNGGGFSPAKLQDIQEQLASSDRPADYRRMKRVGLLNVHYRMQVYYQDRQTGVCVCNHPVDGGALVQLKFPVHRRSGDGRAGF